MRRILALFLAMVLVFATACTRCGPGTSSADRAAKLSDETVALVHTGLFGKSSYCTGVWIDAKYILTAAHCTEDEDEFEYIVAKQAGGVRSEPAVTYSAKLVKVNSDRDLALLQALEGPEYHAVAKLAVEMPQVGDPIFVIGHPLGMYWTYAVGTVGAYYSGVVGIDSTGPFIQILAPITHGNSGGGVFDANGNLVGIVGFGPSSAPGFAFAYHRNSIRDFLFEPGK